MIIHAVSIHSGGGKVLLDQLLIEKNFGEVTALICDERYKLPEGLTYKLEVHRVSPNLISRWKAEALLKKLSQVHLGMNVLCFSNLPPAFKLSGKVILYLQNALLLPGIPLYTDSKKVALRLMYEKIWSFIFWKNIDEVWVQTAWMKKALSKSKKLIQVKPFLPSMPKAMLDNSKQYDFVTISGTASHKRLIHLLKTWACFSKDSMPSLLVVTDGLNNEIENLVKNLGDKVFVKVNASREDIFKYYEKSRALVITSKLESFCLPLYEAAHFKLHIFAPREDYVLDSGLADILIDLADPEVTKNDIAKHLPLIHQKKLS